MLSCQVADIILFNLCSALAWCSQNHYQFVFLLQHALPPSMNIASA
uniref:Uncharacterized protein n=1 Tax=Rhizophora mucronata TaxID=61149 RepID=A0A2P2NI02_RHIMU